MMACVVAEHITEPRLILTPHIDALPGRCGGRAQASRQAKHCAHKGILIEQSVLGSLPLWKKNKGMYNNTSGYVQTGFRT